MILSDDLTHINKHIWSVFRLFYHITYMILNITWFISNGCIRYRMPRSLEEVPIWYSTINQRSSAADPWLSDSK